MAYADKITLCSLTSRLRDEPERRPLVMPAVENGLALPSEVQVDWIFTHSRAFVGARIGQLDEATMARVDQALRLWLDL